MILQNNDVKKHLGLVQDVLQMHRCRYIPRQRDDGCGCGALEWEVDEEKLAELQAIADARSLIEDLRLWPIDREGWDCLDRCIEFHTLNLKVKKEVEALPPTNFTELVKELYELCFI